ncbi:MAG: CYTH domain-containing protein [Proteobacteria bacterium]|nr:CYTH domain-containing protein [Pseudomonadota bacterium]
MARNIEIKARVPQLEAVAAAAHRLGADGPVEILQDDSFFACPNGRLKLRAFADGTGELIFYRRADQAGPKESFYLRSRTPDPDVLRESLTLAYGCAGRVRKKRLLYMHGRTRIHLDQVQGLGTFVELEVVLREDESAEDGTSEAHRLMQLLSIDRSELIEGAYVDLLQAATPALPPALKDTLAARHREPGRHYHGIAHVEALLRWLDQSRDLASDARAIEAAIWFHDAVYDPRSASNEADSAQLARSELAALQWPTHAVEKVQALVLATAGHASDGIADEDTRLFLDLDLSILGQPAPVYASYSAAIRAEYAHIEEAAYIAGRRRVLESFLSRPSIYQTTRWRNAWEAQAQANIRHELQSLTLVQEP